LTPAADSERLDFCVKSETTIEVDPSVLAAAYMDVEERHKWHSACEDSRLVEDVWPHTMRIAVFTYRTELPVFPRGYCALMYRASHRLPDGRTQIIITDRSVVHPAMPTPRQFIFMTVYPSGMMITPLQNGEQTHSHVKLISHFHLRGTVSPVLLQRIKANRMLEACCFNYLHEFRNHVLPQSVPRLLGAPAFAPEPRTTQAVPMHPQPMEGVHEAHPTAMATPMHASDAIEVNAQCDAGEEADNGRCDAAAALMHSAAGTV